MEYETVEKMAGWMIEGHPPIRQTMDGHQIRGPPSGTFVERRFQQTTLSGGSCSIVGGYQYTFLDPNHELFLCIICKNVAKDIYQVTCCGKHLCKDCLQSCRVHQGELCPHCRTENLHKNHFPDTSANKKVLSLMVSCPNSDKGCSWKGEVRNVECHMTHCNYCLVKCGCGEKVMKCNQQKHNSDECGLRMTNCPNCNERGNYTWLATSHGEVCPGKVINCPNQGCDVTAKRYELAKHLETCTKAKVACQHSWLGCKEVVSRENQTLHEQQQLRQHLEMAEAWIKQLENPNRDEYLCSKVERVPITFKIEAIQSKLDAKEVWQSEGFYSDIRGYKMCLRVHLNGTGCGADTHISYFLHLMPGLYDDDLPWPFQGKVVVQVLNQMEDGKHSRHEKQFLSHIPTEYNKRVCGKAMNEVGLGEPRFLPHRDLTPKPESNINYVKDGSLYVQVHKIEVYSVPQSWLRVFH